jgi:hypothetical protein
MNLEQKKRGPRKLANKMDSAASSASEDPHNEHQAPKKQRIMTIPEKQIGGSTAVTTAVVSHVVTAIHNDLQKAVSAVDELDQLVNDECLEFAKIISTSSAEHQIISN